MAAEGYMAMILYERRYVFVAIVMVTYTVWFKVKKLQHVGGFEQKSWRFLSLRAKMTEDLETLEDSSDDEKNKE